MRTLKLSLAAISLILISVLVISCGSEEMSADSSGTVNATTTTKLSVVASDGWTDAIEDDQVASCVNVAMAGTSSDVDLSATFRKGCGCLFKAVRKNYSYSKFQSSQRDIVETILKDGTYSSCFKEAQANHTVF